MHRRMLALSTVALAAAATLAVGGTAQAAPVPVAAAVTTITYDDSQAGEFTTVVAQGVAALNSRVTNVRIVRATAGTTANVRVIADNGWPRATLGPVRPSTRGTVWMGREAVADGYNAVRIAAHEFGHILGLPDNRTGLCSDLMSGSSAPTSCANQYPSPAEAQRINRNYATALAVAPGRLIVDTA